MIRKKRIKEHFQILGAMKIGKGEITWTAMRRVADLPLHDLEYAVCPEGVLLPEKKRGEKIRVTYTTMHFKDF